jgi:hypothetical protein
MLLKKPDALCVRLNWCCGFSLPRLRLLLADLEKACKCHGSNELNHRAAYHCVALSRF